MNGVWQCHLIRLLCLDNQSILVVLSPTIMIYIFKTMQHLTTAVLAPQQLYIALNVYEKVAKN